MSIKREKVRVVMEYEISYDTSVPNAREPVLREIAPHQDRSGCGLNVGCYSVKAGRVLECGRIVK